MPLNCCAWRLSAGYGYLHDNGDQMATHIMQTWREFMELKLTLHYPQIISVEAIENDEGD